MKGRSLRNDYIEKYNQDKLVGPPSKEVDDLIFDIFATEVEFFRQLEFERHKFALKFGNQAKELFNKIDRYSTGSITYEYLERFFKITDYILTKEEFRMIMWRFGQPN